MTDLRHIDSWVFDLDNTLYDAECALFAQIDQRMTSYVSEHLSLERDEARRVQKDYYQRFGTTMSGLMREHGVDPEHFMDFVHDIDLGALQPNQALSQALSQLPGKRYIFTNGSAKHAENVARALDIFHHFDAVFDIKSAQYTPKPHRAPYDEFLGKFGVDPAQAIMFEDLSENLRTPYELGMTTVLVCSDAAWTENEPSNKRPARRGDGGDHVHHAIDDLAGFLAGARKASPTE